MSIFDVISEVKEYLILAVVFLSGMLARGVYDRSIEKWRDRTTAKRLFRKILNEDKILFSGTFDGLAPSIKPATYLSDAFAAHSRVLAEYSPFLFCIKRKRLEKAVNDYHNYLRNNKFTKWFNLRNDFLATDEVENHIQESRKLIDKILSFAKE